MSAGPRRKPARLTPGMVLGVVSPASPISAETIAAGADALRSLGFQVLFGSHVHDDAGDLAGSDADRARDLAEMIYRDDVDGIVCTRGGTGSLRTAMKLESMLGATPPRPKPFIGYSDVTFLHALFAAKLGWTTFHGPMLHHWSRHSAHTLDAFRAALMEPAPFQVRPDPGGIATRTLVPGVAEGLLVGGWLEALVDLIGTPWEPELQDNILFFEDVQKLPREVDRQLSVLVASGRLKRCAGIVIGEHERCGRDGYARLEPVFREWIEPLGIPCIARLPLGHGEHMATLPLGVRAALDATAGTLTIVEPGVS